MNRRHFLKTTGMPMGVVLLAPAVGTLCSCRHTLLNEAASDLIGLPDKISVQTDQGILALPTSDRYEWSRGAVAVRLGRVGNSLRVHVRSPQVPLNTVILSWKHRARAQAKYLGDAWERSYGDLRWSGIVPDVVMPWYFMEYDGELTHGFGVKTGCRAMAGWQVDNGTLKLLLDVRSGGQPVRLGQRILSAVDIVARQGRAGESSFQATSAFCKVMCDRPKLPPRPMVGTLDWYYAYGKCTERLFVSEAELFARLVEGCDVAAFALVDAGWAVGDRNCWPDDQTVSHPDFGSIQAVAAKVRTMGLVPGIWTRVLCANPKDPASFRFSRDASLLDPSLPTNLQRIRELIRLYRSWGFAVVKHDFSTFDIFGRWGRQMQGLDLTTAGWTFQDSTLTTAEVILGLYRAIREGCGDDVMVIGCNTISHLSAGLVEYCRIGDDSGGSLEQAMKCGCNPFAFRLPQNRSFYIIDPDCIGNLAQIPWRYYQQFIRLTSESGALLETSTRLGTITAEQRSFLREAFQRLGANAPRPVEPLDWMEHSTPAKWRIGTETVEMEWGPTSVRTTG